jgi:hypothetical protein
MYAILLKNDEMYGLYFIYCPIAASLPVIGPKLQATFLLPA